MTRFIINNSFLNEIASRILSGNPNPLKNWIIMLMVAAMLMVYAVEHFVAAMFSSRPHRES